MACAIEEVGVEAVVKGFPEFVAKLQAMSLAIKATGTAGLAAKGGLAVLTLALGAIVAVAAAVVGGIALIIAGFFGIASVSVGVARSVESAFAGVAKTTNGLTDEFGKMNEAGEAVLDQFRELAKEVPLALEELLKIGEFAGQLGIAKEALVGFTEVVAALAVATELSTEEAALGLARLAGIYEISTENMIENTERLGSAITFLGNNFKTNEPAILNFSKRLAGIAKPLGFSQAEVLGLGAAFTSAGVEAQLGGTAVQNAMIAMAKAVSDGGDELDTFASVSGKTAEEFSEQWETDAAGAFVDFIEGLGDAGDEAFNILDDVGLSSDRTVRALLPVAGAGDLLRDAIEGSTQAWEDNLSLTREAEIRYATFDSQMQIFKNTVRDIGLEIGLALLPKLQALLDIFTPIVEAIGAGLIPAFDSIFDALETHLLPALGRLLDAFGFDITSASLTEGIANFGEKIAGGIETFAGFVDRVAELVDLYKEGGIDSVAEHFGISKESVQLFEDIGATVLIAAGAFVALRTALVVGATVAGIIAAIGTLGGTFLLAAEAGGGLIATLAFFAAAALSPVALVLALIAAVSLLIGVIVVFGERALIALNQLFIIGIVLLVQFVEDTITLFSNMWTSIKENTIKAREDFNRATNEWIDGANQKWSEFVESTEAFFADMWERIKENTATAIDDFIQGISDWRDRTVEKIVELGVNAVMAVINWWNDMIAALNEKGTEWGVAIGLWVIDITTKLREGIAGWIEAGKEMMNGLLQGLGDNVGKVIDFISDLAIQILDTILGVFGVESPSKEFAKIGEELMAGLALGISQNAALPQIALDAAATRMISAEGGIANAGATTGNIDRSFNPTITANYSETQTPSTIASDLALIAMLEGAG